MIQTGVDVADNFVRADLAPRGALHVLNGGFRHLQALELLLRNRVGNPRMLRSICWSV
jgi:hypothetical protein